MATEDDSDVPESGAVFTFGKSKFADNEPNKFWIRKDRVVQVACGDEHSALVAESGRIFTFGANDWGQLGLGHTNPATKPSCVKSLKHEKVRKVCCGRSNTFVATESGHVYGFGGNGDSQMGSGAKGPMITHPIRVEGLPETRYKSLSAGSDHVAALTEEGELYVWGGGSEGQLGLGDDLTESETPQKVDLDERVTCVACGYYHTALATESGKMYTFGEKDSGKLGLGEQVSEHTTPQEVEGIKGKVKAVACGGSHTLAITEDGQVYVFGEGQYGQLGHGTIILETPQPQHVISLQETPIQYGSCGESHTAIISGKGNLYTFGDGSHGKLGLGIENFANQFRPSLVHRFGKMTVEEVACGGCHMLVLAHPRLTGSDADSDNDDVAETTQHNGGPPHMAAPHFLDHLRNSEDLNLSGSFSARDRRREKIEPAASTLNRTLPPLTSNLSASQRSLPSINAQNSTSNNPLNRSMLPPVKHKENEDQKSNLKAKMSDDDEDDKESGVSSDEENKKPAPVSVEVTTEATVHSSPPPAVSVPVPKPRQSPVVEATTANTTAASPTIKKEAEESSMEETDSSEEDEEEEEEKSVPKPVTESKPVPLARGKRPVPRKPISDDDESDETDEEEAQKEKQNLKEQLMSNKMRNGKMAASLKKKDEKDAETESEESEEEDEDEEEEKKKKEQDKKPKKGHQTKPVVMKKQSREVKSQNKKNKAKQNKKKEEESEEETEPSDEDKEESKNKKKMKAKYSKEDEEEIKKEEEDDDEEEEDSEKEEKKAPEPKKKDGPTSLGDKPCRRLGLQ